VNSPNSGLNFLILGQAGWLTFPLKVGEHSPGNISLHSLCGELIGGLTLFEGKGLHLRQQFSGKPDIRIGAHDAFIISLEL